FEKDRAPTPEEMLTGPRAWSGANVHLWAKYFRARARLAAMRRTPLDARRLILEAADVLGGTESGLVNSQVSRLRILVRGLAAMCGGGIDIAKVLRELDFEQRVFGQSEMDDGSRRFLNGA